MTDAGGKPNSLETWAMVEAEQLFPLMEHDDRVKLAIGLIQARADESLHYSGKFAIGDYLKAIATDRARLGLPSLEAAFAVAFSERHAALQNFAMAFAERHLKEKESKVIQ